MTAYPFIEAERAADRNVAAACRMLEVSSSAYYEWNKQVPSQRELDDAELLETIKKIHAASRGNEVRHLCHTLASAPLPHTVARLR